MPLFSAQPRSLGDKVHRSVAKNEVRKLQVGEPRVLICHHACWPDDFVTNCVYCVQDLLLDESQGTVAARRAAIEHPDAQGRTPLMRAVALGSYMMTKLVCRDPCSSCNALFLVLCPSTTCPDSVVVLTINVLWITARPGRSKREQNEHSTGRRHCAPRMRHHWQREHCQVACGCRCRPVHGEQTRYRPLTPCRLQFS